MNHYEGKGLTFNSPPNKEGRRGLPGGPCAGLKAAKDCPAVVDKMDTDVTAGARKNKCPLWRSRNGFALVAAILACVILMALAMLVIHLSTQDLRSSSRNVGDKKALSAAETGIHRMMQNFDPQAPSSTAQSNQQVSTADPNSVYDIGAAQRPTTGPTFLPLTGFSIGGGQSWGQACYVVDVTGRNTAYGTSVIIGTGVGYGPIEISTMSR